MLACIGLRAPRCYYVEQGVWQRRSLLSFNVHLFDMLNFDMPI